MLKRIGKQPNIYATAGGMKTGGTTGGTTGGSGGFNWQSLASSLGSAQGSDMIGSLASSIGQLGTALNAMNSAKYAKENPANLAGIGSYEATAVPVYSPFAATGNSFTTNMNNWYANHPTKNNATSPYHSDGNGNWFNSSGIKVDASEVQNYAASQPAPKAFGGSLHRYDAGGYIQAADTAIQLGTDAIANYKSKSSIKDTSGISKGIGALAGTKFAGSNEDLLSQFGTTGHYGHINYKSLLNGSGNLTFGDVLQSNTSAYKGMSAGANFGPWGAAIGGIVGGASSLLTSIFGRSAAKRKAKKQANLLNAQGTAANAAALNSLEAAAANNDQQAYRNAELQYGAMNTGLGKSNAVPSAFGGRIFDEGGFLANHGAVWAEGLNKFNTGGTHEQNPNGGIPQGYDALGTPNLVEEGEYRWDDESGKWGSYIFSNRLEIPKKFARKYKLGGSKSFAKGIDKFLKDNNDADMQNDPAWLRTKNAFLDELATVQEQVRQEQEMKEFMEQLQQMSPEERQQVLSQIAQQMQAQQQSQQASEAQQQMQETPGMEAQQQQMQQPQPQQEPTIEQQQQLAQQRPMMDQGQEPIMEDQAQAMAANGGRIFANGGNVKSQLEESDSRRTDAQTEAEQQDLEAQEQQQRNTQQAQEQDEESQAQELDDQIDQILDYARENGNKELIAGARRAYRGSIEEKKAFIDRANSIIQQDRKTLEEQNNQEQEQQLQAQQEQQLEQQALASEAAVQSAPEGQAATPEQQAMTQQFANGGNLFAGGGSEDDDTVPDGLSFYRLLRQQYPNISNQDLYRIIRANRAGTDVFWDDYDEAMSQKDGGGTPLYNNPESVFEYIIDQNADDFEQDRGKILNAIEEFLRSQQSARGAITTENTVDNTPSTETTEGNPTIVDRVTDWVDNAEDYIKKQVTSLREKLQTEKYRSQTKEINRLNIELEQAKKAEESATSDNRQALKSKRIAIERKLNRLTEAQQEFVDNINKRTDELKAKDVKIKQDRFEKFKTDLKIAGSSIDEYNAYKTQHGGTAITADTFDPKDGAIYLKGAEKGITIGATAKTKQAAIDEAYKKAGQQKQVEERQAKSEAEKKADLYMKRVYGKNTLTATQEQDIRKKVVQDFIDNPDKEVISNKKQIKQEKAKAKYDLHRQDMEHRYGPAVSLETDADWGNTDYYKMTPEEQEAFNASQPKYIKAGRFVVGDPQNNVISQFDATDQNTLQDQVSKFYQKYFRGYLNQLHPGAVNARNEGNWMLHHKKEWDGWIDYLNNLNADNLIDDEIKNMSDEEKAAYLASEQAKAKEIAALEQANWAIPTRQKDWEFKGSLRDAGTVTESPAYHNWVESLKSMSDEDLSKLGISREDIELMEDSRKGIKHVPRALKNFYSANAGAFSSYYIKDANGVEHRVNFNPAEKDKDGNYYQKPAQPELKKDPLTGRIEYKWVFTPNDKTNRYYVDRDLEGNPVYYSLTEEQAAQMNPDGADSSYIVAPYVNGTNKFYGEKPADNTGKAIKFAEGLLPDLGGLAQLAYQIANPPNNSYFERGLGKMENIPMVGYQGLGNYVAPYLMDIHHADNLATAKGLSAAQAGIDTSNGNADKARNAALIANYGLQQGLALNLIEGMKWNADQYEKAQNHNFEVDKMDAQLALEAAKANQGRGKDIGEAYLAAADKLTDNEASWKTGIYQGIGKLVNKGNTKYDSLFDSIISSVAEDELRG